MKTDLADTYLGSCIMYLVHCECADTLHDHVFLAANPNN